MVTCQHVNMASPSSEPDHETASPVTAIPDTASTCKKSKLFHASLPHDDIPRLEVPHGSGSRTEPATGNVSDPSSDSEPSAEVELVGEGSESDDTMMSDSAPVELKEEEWWDLRMSWGGRVYDLKVGGNDMCVLTQLRWSEELIGRVYDFRAAIQGLTAVPPARQKLIGLLTTSKSKLGFELDSTRFRELGVKKGGKFTMVGTPEGEEEKVPKDYEVRCVYANGRR